MSSTQTGFFDRGRGDPRKSPCRGPYRRRRVLAIGQQREAEERRPFGDGCGFAYGRYRRAQ